MAMGTIEYSFVVEREGEREREKEREREMRKVKEREKESVREKAIMKINHQMHDRSFLIIFSAPFFSIHTPPPHRVPSPQI